METRADAVGGWVVQGDTGASNLRDGGAAEVRLEANAQCGATFCPACAIPEKCHG